MQEICPPKRFIFTSKCTKMRLVARLHPESRTHWVSLQRSPDPLAGLGGEMGGEWDRERGGRGKRREEGGKKERRRSANVRTALTPMRILQLTVPFLLRSCSCHLTCHSVLQPVYKGRSTLCSGCFSRRVEQLNVRQRHRATLCRLCRIDKLDIGVRLSDLSQPSVYLRFV